MATHNTSGNYGKPGNSLPDDVKAEVVRLARAGVARNAIATQLGIGRASVTGICQRAGVKFDRAATKLATEAHRVDMAARRAELAQGLLDDVAKLRSQLFTPAVVFNIGGKDNVYTEHEVPEPPAESKLKLMQAVGAAIDRHIRLDLHDSDRSADDAKSLLGELGRALGVTGPNG
jgi:hypothetical protein